MQNSFALERKLHETVAIWDVVADLQETARLSDSLDFIKCVDYWVFNTLLNQPRVIPGENLMSAIKEKDHLTILADYAVNKFMFISPAQRLSKLGFVMNYVYPWTNESKNAINELRSQGLSLNEGECLEFQMLDIKKW